MLFFVIIVYISFISCYFIFFFFYPRVFKVRTCVLRPRFTHKGVYKQRRFWATYVNRKWTFFSSNMPWCPLLAGGMPSSRFLLNTLIKSLLLRCQVNFVSLSLFTLIETFCPKIRLKSRVKTVKSPLAVDVRRSKALLNKLPIFYSAYRLLSSDQKDWHQTEQNFFSHLKNNNSNNNDNNNILQ